MAFLSPESHPETVLTQAMEFQKNIPVLYCNPLEFITLKEKMHRFCITYNRRLAFRVERS